MGKEEEPYYYAAGDRKSLTIDEDYLAVDTFLYADFSEEEVDEINSKGRNLQEGITLIKSSDFSEDMWARLLNPDFHHKVYRFENIQLIVFSEIRVEDSRDDLSLSVSEWLRKNEETVIPVEIIKQGRLVVYPQPNNGKETLAIANRLYEELNLESVQPGFFLIMPGPSVTED